MDHIRCYHCHKKLAVAVVLPHSRRKHPNKTISILKPRLEEDRIRYRTYHYHYNPRQCEEYKDAFSQFDIDGDGRISAPELRTVMTSLGLKPTDADLDAAIKDVDEDGNGTMEFEEFLQLMWKHQQTEGGDWESQVRHTFNTFDSNGDGFICASELREVMANMGDELSEDEINEMITEADMDGDKQINFQEFLLMMAK